jgi:hypothetical protein
MNATEAAKLAEENERDARANMLLERMLEDFAKDFMPLNAHQSLRFHTALSTIVRQATVDANRVYGDQLTKHTSALMALSMPPRMVVPAGIVDPDLKPGGIVYVPRRWAIRPLNWLRPAVNRWTVNVMGHTYAVQELNKAFAVTLDGGRIAEAPTLEAAQQRATDDVERRVFALLAEGAAP